MGEAATLEFPRRFVAEDATFGSWEMIAPWYEALREREVSSVDELEQWLLDWSEVDAAFGEEETRRYTAMTCNTEDETIEKAFLVFVEQVRPKREPVLHELREKLVALAEKYPLPKKRYEVLLRSVRNELELFREENIALLTEDAKLQQKYQKVVGGLTVEWGGEEKTLPQVTRLLEEPERELREKAWQAVAERYAAHADELDGLYAEMVKLRDQIGRNAGTANYRDYAFRMYERFDYSPEDCRAFHDAIEKVVVPVAGKLAAERRRKLGLEALRPWDLSVDPENRPPLRPFAEEAELVAGCGQVFEKVNPELAKIFGELAARGTLDLSSRRGKAPGGYQATFDERRLPFIFMNAVGTEGDVRTLLHEGGHAFHTWACRQEPLKPYRSAPIEFCEVASMGMECLALPHLEVFYGTDTDRARKRFLEGIVNFFPWMARVDAFQHYVYTHVAESIEQWKDEWVRLATRFSPEVDWSGLEDRLRTSWHRKLHFFEVPFYYVEYGIAQLGALQVWMNSRRDYEQAVAMYWHALSLGGMRPLPELFETAGGRFDFSEETLRPLMEAVMEEIEMLSTGPEASA